MEDNAVDYTITSKPNYVTFTCPHCGESVDVIFDKVDYITDYWGDGAWVDCPECGKEVELGNYDYN